MARKTFTDKKLRDVVSQLKFGEPERNTYARTDTDSTFHLPRIYAGVNYNFDNGLVIRADPVTVKKLAKHNDDGNVSLEDRLEYQETEKEEIADFRKEEDAAEEEFKEAMKAWKTKYPNYRRKKKSKGSLTIPMAEIERPNKRSIGMTLGGPKHNLGILIKNYEDTERFTAKLTSAVVRYQDEDAIMNYDLLKETTDLKEGDLLKIMDRLKERYQVEISYKDGEALRRRVTPPYRHLEGQKLLKERQNNVFSLKLTPRMTVVQMVEAVTRVYQAGEAFKKGLYKLQEEKGIREDHERDLEQRRQTKVVDTF